MVSLPVIRHVATREVRTDPEHLPPGTFLRFAVLSATLFAATASIYRHLGTLITDADAKMAVCLNGAPLEAIASQAAPGSSGTQGLIGGVITCSTDMPRLLLESSGTGLLVTAVATWALMSVLPMLSIHRRRLSPLALTIYPATDTRLRSAETRLALQTRPIYWIEMDGRRIEGRAFGTSRRPQVSLTVGLITSCEQGRATEAVDAAILHELAHIARRDVGRTYLAVASWWVFVAVTVVPFLVTAAWRSSRHPAAHEIRPLLTAGILIALVYVARTGVLRNREFSADALAAHVDPAAVRTALTRSSADGTGRYHPWAKWFRWHPTRTARRTALEQPSVLFRPPVSALLLVGMTIGIITAEVTGTLTFLLGLPDGVHWVRLVTWTLWVGATVVIAGALVVTGWGSWTGRPPGEVHVSALRPGIALAAGVIIGEPLSISSATAGMWGTIGVHGTTLLLDEVVSGIALATLLCGLCSWGVACAAVGSMASGLPRRGQLISVVVGTVGILLPTLAWWVLHRLPIISQFQLDRGGSSSALGEDDTDTFLGPFRSWIESEYFPLQAISFHPWYAISIAAPFILWTCALARCRSATGSTAYEPRERSGPLASAFRAAAIGIAGYALIALTAASLVRFWLHGWYLDQQSGPAKMYFLFLDTRLIVFWAAVVAIFVSTRWPFIGPALGTVAALMTAVGSAFVTPPIIISAVYGIPRVLEMMSHYDVSFAAYGLVSMSSTIQTVLLCFPLAVISCALADLKRSRRKMARMTTPGPAGRGPVPSTPKPVWGYVGAATMATGIVTGAIYGF